MQVAFHSLPSSTVSTFVMTCIKNIIVLLCKFTMHYVVLQYGRERQRAKKAQKTFLIFLVICVCICRGAILLASHAFVTLEILQRNIRIIHQ